MNGFTCEDERQRIKRMLTEVKETMLNTASLDHNAPSEQPVTQVILDVLETVSDQLTSGISVNMFRHLYPQ